MTQSFEHGNFLFKIMQSHSFATVGKEIVIFVSHADHLVHQIVIALGCCLTNLVLHVLTGPLCLDLCILDALGRDKHATVATFKDLTKGSCADSIQHFQFAHVDTQIELFDILHVGMLFCDFLGSTLRPMLS